MNKKVLNQIKNITIALLPIAILIYFINQLGVERFTHIIQSQGIWGGFIAVIYMIISVVLGPINSLTIMPVIFLIYGPILSIVLIFTSNCIGGSINFFLARRYGEKIIVKLLGKSAYDKVTEFTHGLDRKSFLMLRSVGVLYSDYVSYAAGLTKLTYKEFVTISFPVFFLWDTFKVVLIAIVYNYPTPLSGFVTLSIYLLSAYGGIHILKSNRIKKTNS